MLLLLFYPAGGPSTQPPVADAKTVLTSWSAITEITAMSADTKLTACSAQTDVEVKR